METQKLAVEGPLVITPTLYGDDRGFFVESFAEAHYGEVLGAQHAFVQDNLSRSQKGVLRGLHYQKEPHAQGKLVSVLSGSVYDVAVDMRAQSETCGQYVSVELRAPWRGEEGVWRWTQFWIPPGFAHGFLALEDDTLFAYKCTAPYAPEADAGIAWNDPAIGIAWPEIDVPILVSAKDQKHDAFEACTLYSAQ